jgi:arabinose-5-phosphate isomerase
LSTRFFLFRTNNLTSHRTCRSSSRGCQIDLDLRGSHTSEEVAVVGGNNALAVGQDPRQDALAVALLDARGFSADDFARSHPGGALGRKLLTHVRDVMRSGEQVPRVLPQVDFSTLMREMSAKGMGAAAVVDEAGRPIGIFTDGDLRRRIEAGADLRGMRAQDIMHANPRTIAADALAADAAQLMEQHSITSVLVTEPGGVLVGVVHIGDLMRAKVI